MPPCPAAKSLLAVIPCRSLNLTEPRSHVADCSPIAISRADSRQVVEEDRPLVCQLACPKSPESTSTPGKDVQITPPSPRILAPMGHGSRLGGVSTAYAAMGFLRGATACVAWEGSSETQVVATPVTSRAVPGARWRPLPHEPSTFSAPRTASAPPT